MTGFLIRADNANDRTRDYFLGFDRAPAGSNTIDTEFMQ